VARGKIPQMDGRDEGLANFKTNRLGYSMPVWYDVEKNPDIIVTFVSKDSGNISGDLRIS